MTMRTGHDVSDVTSRVQERRPAWMLLVVFGLLAVSCGVSESEQTSPTTVGTTSPTTTTSTSVSTTELAATDQDVETYLVEMSNLAADLDNRLQEFECSYNEQFSPGFCGGGFVEEAEDYEPPPEPTDEELLEYQRGYWQGALDLRLAHADMLASIQPPSGFETAHMAYVDDFRAYFAYVEDEIAGFESLSEFEAFFTALFDPLAEVPAEHERLLLAMVESCRSLEILGEDAGFETDLGCPSPPDEPVFVTVEIGEDWSAAPNPLAVGDGLVAMTITNMGTEAIRPVVLDIFEGDPLQLPVVDGVVDLSRSGVVFDELAPSTMPAFGLSYAGEEVFVDEFGISGQPPELSPGASVEAQIWSAGTIVVFDYRPGEFEAGAYVIIDRSDS